MADLTGNVSTVANVLYPYGVILGFVGTVFTVVFALVKFRGLIFKLFAGLGTSKRETERKGGIFARIFRSLDETKSESKAAKENTARTNDALVLMTEALVEERKATERLQASRDAEARQNDELLARTLRTLARYDQAQVLERLRKLERPNEAFLPTEPVLPGPEAGLISITGKHRLRTTNVPTITEDETDDAW